MKKNNKNLIIIVLILTFLFILWNIGKEKVKNNIVIEEVVVQRIYLNYAWGFSGEATVICKNGDVYNVDLEKISSELNNMTEKEINNYVMNFGEKLENVVCNEEIEEILNKGIYLTPITKDNSNGGKYYDYGTLTTKVYNKEKGKYMILSIKGDQQRINISSESKQLNQIIENIINRIYNQN
jgi:hypothetical protein